MWFGQGDDVDRRVREGFADAIPKAVAGAFDSWAETARGRLALILLLDQFPRHLHRHTRAAYDGDAKALALATDGIDTGLDRSLPAFERVFFCMPLHHAEDLAQHDVAVQIVQSLLAASADFERPVLARVASFFDAHRATIARFGRFPHRNAPLGRASTDEERAFVEEQPR